MVRTERRIVIALLLGTSAVVVGLGPEPTTQAEPATKVTIRRVPNRGIQPQVAVDSKGIVHLIYFSGDAGGGDILYIRSADSGDTFSQPLRVNSQPGSAMAIGNIRGAQLAVGKNSRVHVAWNGSGKAKPKGPHNAHPMLYTRLKDAGTAFEPERNVIQAATGLDGGGSVAADEQGNVYVAWHAPQPGTQGEENRRVWVTRSADEGQTFDRERPAYGNATGACGCCGMRAFADHQGTVYLLYRSAAATVHRDMYLLRATREGIGFQGDKVHEWKTGICPMSTAAFAESAGSILAAWETDGQVYYVRVDPATGKRSEPGSPPGAAKGRKHPAVAANARGEVILVWTEGMGWNRGGLVAWQVYDKDGNPSAEKGQAEGVPVWSLVAVFARPDGSFVVLY
jgi:hypothetical protein